MEFFDQCCGLDGRAEYMAMRRNRTRPQRGGVESDARVQQRRRRIGTNPNRMQAGVRDPVHEATDRRKDNGADQHGDAQGPQAVHA